MIELTREEVDLFKSKDLCRRCKTKNLYYNPITPWLRMYCPKPGCNFAWELRSHPQPPHVKEALIKFEEMYRKRLIAQQTR